MTVTRRALLAGTAATLAAPALVRAQGSGVLRVGEVNSYTAQPAFTLPYRNGWQLAVAQVNAAGGVLGRKLEVLSRDDAGQPQNATRLAGELLGDNHADLLAGGFLSNVGLALSDYALQNKALYVAGEPLADALVWEKGNPNTFRLRPDTYMQVAMLMQEAAKLPAKRWVTVAPNYEYGQSCVKWFKQMMAKVRPDVTVVAEQWPALGKLDAGPTVAALEQAKPEGIFNVLFGGDLTAFVRAANTRGLFEGRSVVSVLTGEPEYLDPLGDEAPEGWLVTGYPWDQLKTPDNTKFVEDYRAMFKEPPRMGSVVGYTLIHAIVAGVARAGATDLPALIKGFAGAQFDTPFGSANFRSIDHQSTLGAFVGSTALVGGKGAMKDWHYVDGATVMPTDDFVRNVRPA
ncbi:ABC transporter substrate-binding protein [Acidisphaera sp. L21]|uniref:ABC transporter substrate-binding protein n=1 Tax=Acidisphaera sp. L21 TaxID=1641851 RepID=UPI00131DAD4C|nr:ABC transporter substrate-binding protein [Acidisphaera sp. L21]